MSIVVAERFNAMADTVNGRNGAELAVKTHSPRYRSEDERIPLADLRREGRTMRRDRSPDGPVPVHHQP